MMKLKSVVRYYLNGLSILQREFAKQTNPLFNRNRVAAELIRNTHSIEKGLSIKEPRLGFGHKKQREMMQSIMLLSDSENTYHNDACRMAIQALSAYIRYHDAKGFSDDVIEEIKVFLEKRKEFISDDCFGGTAVLKREECEFPVEQIEAFFNTRHSIRDFSQEPVDEDKIRKAVALAQRSPSACNRQGVRVYVLSHEKTMKYAAELEGIGGFAESVDRFILITGKQSSYRIGEMRQFIVSASMYAGYLTLTLHLYQIGACVIQRPLYETKEWCTMRAELGIEEDEQLVCMIAVGSLKDSCVVPYSKRIDSSVFCHFIN